MSCLLFETGVLLADAHTAALLEALLGLRCILVTRQQHSVIGAEDVEVSGQQTTTPPLVIDAGSLARAHALRLLATSWSVGGVDCLDAPSRDAAATVADDTARVSNLIGCTPPEDAWRDVLQLLPSRVGELVRSRCRDLPQSQAADDAHLSLCPLLRQLLGRLSSVMAAHPLAFDGDCSGPDWEANDFGRVSLTASEHEVISCLARRASQPTDPVVDGSRGDHVTVVGPLPPPPSDSNPVCSQRTAELTRLMQFCVARSLSTGFDPNIVAPAGYQMRCDPFALTLGLIMGHATEAIQLICAITRHRPRFALFLWPAAATAGTATEAGADAAVDVAYATSSDEGAGSTSLWTELAPSLSGVEIATRHGRPPVAAATTRGWLSTDESPLLVTAHLVHVVVGIEMPELLRALEMAGTPPANLAVHWLKRCFWGVLEWPCIAAYVTLCITLGIDYQVYFVVAIFQHLRPQILAAAVSGEAFDLLSLLTAPIPKFDISTHAPFLLELQHAHRGLCTRVFMGAVC